MFIYLQELILNLEPENPQLYYVKFPQLKVFEFNCVFVKNQ
jgi:hypothetical protein